MMLMTGLVVVVEGSLQIVAQKHVDNSSLLAFIFEKYHKKRRMKIGFGGGGDAQRFIRNDCKLSRIHCYLHQT